MFTGNHLDINAKGHLTIGGIDSLELAEQYKTPLYVMDEALIRENCQKFKQSMESFYHGNGLVCYASKAFSCKQIYRIMKEEGMGIDVVSMGELYTALAVDFPAEKIYYHGNNKTEAELIYAVESCVGRIVANHVAELEMLNRIAYARKKTVDVYLRLTPGIDAHTHDFVQTGKIDSKFGFTIAFGTALDAVRKVLSLPNLCLKGVHCHIGSQIFDIDPFEHTAQVMLDFIAQVKDELGYEITELNLGGGFGIKYTQNDDPVDYERYMEQVSVVVKKTAKERGLALPYIVIEPGRSIVGAAGITLYKVGGIKDIPNTRKYVSVDGGMTDNIRYALYGSAYEFLVAQKADQPKTDCVTIAGRCCESGDLLGKDIALQPVEIEDILACLSTGAYHYAMASNYNRTLKPATVMVSHGKSYLAIKRESLEDLTRNDV